MRSLGTRPFVDDAVDAVTNGEVTVVSASGDELTLRRRFTRERFHRDDVLDAWSAPADDGYRAHLELADGRILSLVLNPEAARSLVEAVRPVGVADDSAFALARLPRRLSVLARLGPLSRLDPGYEPGLLEKNRARIGMQLAARYESVAGCIAARAALSRSNSASAYRSGAISA